MPLSKLRLRRLWTGQVLAVLAAVTWALLPVLCPAEPATAGDHTHDVASAAEAQGHAADHEHPAKQESDACCHAVSSAKVVVSAWATLSPAKSVLVTVALATVIRVVDEARAPSPKPGRDATGPPSIRTVRYLSYSPLAPPVVG